MVWIPEVVELGGLVDDMVAFGEEYVVPQVLDNTALADYTISERVRRLQ